MSPCKITSPPNTHLTWTIPYRFHRKTQPMPLSVLTSGVNPNTALLSSPCYRTLPHERTAPPLCGNVLRRRKKNGCTEWNKDISKSAQQLHWDQNKHNGFFNSFFLLMSNSKGPDFCSASRLMLLAARWQMASRSKVQESSVSPTLMIVKIYLSTRLAVPWSEWSVGVWCLNNPVFD